MRLREHAVVGVAVAFAAGDVDFAVDDADAEPGARRRHMRALGVLERRRIEREHGGVVADAVRASAQDEHGVIDGDRAEMIERGRQIGQRFSGVAVDVNATKLGSPDRFRGSSRLTSSNVVDAMGGCASSP